MNKPRILLWDLETSHNQVLSFGLWKQDIPFKNIQIERHIYCVSYQWYGEKKIHSISILDDKKRFKKNIHDDYYVVKKFKEVIEQADAQVAHYGDKFDTPMLNARIIANKLNPLPKIISLDTKKIASKYFRFNSNKLDYLANFLGHNGKLTNHPNLWLDCFNGNIKALQQMVKYNRQDIRVLYFIFEKLKPFIQNNPLNSALFYNKNKNIICPNCGSSNLMKKGFSYTRVNKFQRYVCKECNAWCNERTSQKINKIKTK